MKTFSFPFLSCTAAVLVMGSLCARADAKPDFEDDAKPILGQQPGLIEYVESKFEIKDTGIAKYPGDDDHAPVPPYIFRARARGSNGPYNLRLLIQPGPEGHILGIYKDAPAAPQQPAVAKAPVTTPAPQAATPQVPPLTADTPSGPVNAPGTTPASSASSSNAPSLAPPPDPAPTPH